MEVLFIILGGIVIFAIGAFLSGLRSDPPKHIDKTHFDEVELRSWMISYVKEESPEALLALANRAIQIAKKSPTGRYPIEKKGEFKLIK